MPNLLPEAIPQGQNRTSAIFGVIVELRVHHQLETDNVLSVDEKNRRRELVVKKHRSYLKMLFDLMPREPHLRKIDRTGSTSRSESPYLSDIVYSHAQGRKNTTAVLDSPAPLASIVKRDRGKKAG